MLNDSLLLDSTRDFSDNRNISSGCPEHDSVGVLLSWYALRVSYSRELKVKSLLDERGVRTFVPMMWRKKTVDGKTIKQLVPAVNNLCFVFWSRKEIDSFIRGYGENSPVHFYWDRTAGRPLIVPSKEMEDFITISSTLDEDLIYLTEISGKLREGQKVRVRTGAFAGVEGRIVRIRKSRRILVELPGMLAIASTYVNPENLELITT